MSSYSFDSENNLIAQRFPKSLLAFCYNLTPTNFKIQLQNAGVKLKFNFKNYYSMEELDLIFKKMGLISLQDYKNALIRNDNYKAKRKKSHKKWLKKHFSRTFKH